MRIEDIVKGNKYWVKNYLGNAIQVEVLGVKNSWVDLDYCYILPDDLYLTEQEALKSK